jgi:hypothetical protein
MFLSRNGFKNQSQFFYFSTFSIFSTFRKGGAKVMKCGVKVMKYRFLARPFLKVEKVEQIKLILKNNLKI